MFGQEPRLPIDFLLGRVQEPVEGRVHDWILEHQTRLQVGFEGARERLRLATEQRKAQHDQHLRDAPLKEGQQVYLRNVGVRGRHKIQDVWSAVVYQVVRAPIGQGSVYTIAPIGDLSQVRQVHRTLLKARREKNCPEQDSGVEAGHQVTPHSPLYEVCEGNLFLWDQGLSRLLVTQRNQEQSRRLQPPPPL
ncbi:hypothetical protein ACEWY4_024360 [Coilia grayii]|uniref:Uncharacterized protein n=1 Tax=Coilia grayii TaxID=363190 RepID=A0ABD1J056_9TELE